MNLHLNEDQRLLQEAFSRLFSNESTSTHVRAAEATGFDATLWEQCVEMGIPLMRVPEALDGGGLGLMDAVLMAEEAGRSLASAPVVESTVAAHLLAVAGGDEARSWLAKVGDGSAIITLALAPVTPSKGQLVPAASVAQAVLCLHDDRLLLVPQSAPAARTANLGALPLNEWTLPADLSVAVELAQGQAARTAYAAAVDEWKLLSAAQIAAAAHKALEDAAAYSRERTAFDRPIGGYQGLAHPLADSVTDVEGARLLVWRAASLAGKGSPQAAAAVSKAWWWATESGGRATVRAMRTFGGYGMTLEYDAQLYFRRVRSLALLPGNPEHELARLAERLWYAPDAPPPPIANAGDTGIEFDYGAAAADYAAQAEAFFTANLKGREDFAFHSVDGHDPAIHRALGQAGLLYPDWPKAHGGAARSPYETAALYSAFAEAHWPTSVIRVSDMVGKMVMAFGTDAVKQELLPPLLAGTTTCALGYTEPSCGSDIFAAKTRAVKDGDEWVIDGQKMFTSQGHIADYVLLLARTNPDAAKYAGLTLFLVPANVPGYAVQEVKTLGNERTNITYYEGLRIPDRYRLGEINGGVKVMSAALTMEQSAGDFFVAELSAMIKYTERWARASGAIDREEVRRGLAKAHVVREVADTLSRRCVWAFAEHAVGKHHGPMAKLFASEALVSVSTDLMALTAPTSLLQGPTDLGRLELEGRKAIQATIYGGTSEVQRSLIAEAALGMPRTRS
ncbi:MULTISPECIES: acyl-CoA dehydrogenase [Burkholderia]|uniref:acyl-CoA dehydrogenase n=1 Tax=Burkholderia TaxID=32008 RepID=UPI00158E8152|nr:acyl-CoA dehydrogenase [Burkholderia seminalis]